MPGSCATKPAFRPWCAAPATWRRPTPTTSTSKSTGWSKPRPPSPSCTQPSRDPTGVTTAVVEGVVDGGELARILQPRDGIVAERVSAEGQFALLEGPFESYVRVVDVQ